MRPETCCAIWKSWFAKTLVLNVMRILWQLQYLRAIRSMVTGYVLQTKHGWVLLFSCLQKPHDHDFVVGNFRGSTKLVLVLVHSCVGILGLVPRSTLIVLSLAFYYRYDVRARYQSFIWKSNCSFRFITTLLTKSSESTLLSYKSTTTTEPWRSYYPSPSLPFL